jgi:serralysin
MQVSKYISGISPDFTLTRDGNEVTATFFYGLTGYYDEDLGYYLWDGELGAEIGAFANYLHQTADYPMDLELAATLAPGVTAAGSYFVNDNIGGASFDQKFNVTLFDVAANFTGTATVDLVFGSAAADTFRSVGSGDIFEGGAGNDLYRVYSADTQVVEIAGGGNDRVASGVSYLLAAGVHVELLTTNGVIGTSNINLTGNEFSQTIIGNAGNNYLSGLGGDDTVIGGKGADVLDGGSGFDTASYAGSNGVHASLHNSFTNTGDAKSDTYIGIENLTGSSVRDQLEGDKSANILNGGGGDDTLICGHDNKGGDTLIGGTGYDTARYYHATTGLTISLTNQALNTGAAAGNTHSSIERIDGSGFNDRLMGDKAANELHGDGGNDILYGYFGNDVLAGWEGNDSYVFSTKLGPDNVDHVAFMNPTSAGGIYGDDRFLLSDQIFAGLGTPGGRIDSSVFRSNTLGAAVDANDRIVYDNNNGLLYYDPDGNGAAEKILFATVDHTITTITWHDFSVY